MAEDLKATAVGEKNLFGLSILNSKQTFWMGLSHNVFYQCSSLESDVQRSRILP